jgi:pectate lyase
MSSPNELTSHYQSDQARFRTRTRTTSSLLLIVIVALASGLWACGCAGTIAHPSSSFSPHLSTSSAKVAFDSLQVGSNSTKNLFVSNTGTGSLTITAVTVSGSAFSISGTLLPLTLSAGQSTTVTVRFTPTSAGNATGSASFLSTALNSPTVVSLSGTGATQPSSGVTSVVVAPTTASAVTGATIQFTSTVQGSNQSVTWKASLGAITSSGFYTAPSSPVTALVTATSNADPTKSASATVTITSPPSSGTLTSSPTSLSFGNVNVGTSSSKTATLTNTGNSSMNVSSGSVSGAGFSISDLTPLTLGAGQSTTFSVNFAPTATGSVSGSLLVASNATNSPTQITLTGSGVQPAAPAGPLAAFPGAQGGGALSVGGRGGSVFEVTNLNDSGTGSLRGCVEASGPRTCVFKTGGTIALLSSLTVSNPFITIAGQTAPGGGIQISGPSGANAPSNPSFYVRAHDVVIRYLRVRRGFNTGEICNQSPWSCGADVVILSNSASDNPYNIMIDHVSLEWSDYDAFIALGSVTNQPHSVTVSHSILGEALAGAGQVVGSNSSGYSGQGSTAPDGMTDLDFHHNLFAGTSHRMPLMTVKSGRLVNNFVYAWTYYPMRSKGLRDFVNNYFKTRSGQTAPSHEVQAWTTNDGNDTSFAPSFYVTGNVGPSDPSGTSNWNSMTALSVNESGSEASSPLSTVYQRSSPLPTPAGYVSITADPVSTISSASGSMLNTARSAPYDGVGASRRLDCAGNWVDAQDSVDSRIVNAVANGTPLYGSYDYSSLSASPQSQADLGGWPTLAAGTPCTDSDHDGIPDAWEIAHGLNPNDASDAQKTAPNGYTYLENYLNGTDPNVRASANSTTSLWATLLSSGDNMGDSNSGAFLSVRKGNHIYRVRQSSRSDLRAMRQR